MNGHVLVVDDDPAFCEAVERALGSFEVSCFQNPTDALDALKTRDFDVCASGMRMSGMSRTWLCEQLVARRPDLPVVLITECGDLDTAVDAIRAGAYDFLTRPVDFERLEASLRRAIERTSLKAEVRLRHAMRPPCGLLDLLGASAPMQEVLELIARVSVSDVTVLVTGESGTGKELVARAIHRHGQRPDGPLVAINCAAIPEALLESELFGHVRGAFTDAHRAQAGLFVQAEGGTLLLDEIGELPLSLQPKLLRALQEKVIRPVGADREIPFNARLIAVTSRDLEAAVNAGRFREALLYRINVVQIDVPPLRARGGDVLLLAQALLKKHARQLNKPVVRISASAAEKLVAYAWPGNVRELENCIERAVALTSSDQIGLDDLPRRVREHKRSHIWVARDDAADLPPMEEVERRYVLRVMEATNGRRVQAARILGFDRKTLYRKLRSYGIDGPESS
jgi:two-component system, NtrC family, response regulator AtoC